MIPLNSADAHHIKTGNPFSLHALVLLPAVLLVEGAPAHTLYLALVPIFIVMSNLFYGKTVRRVLFIGKQEEWYTEDLG